MEISNLLGCAVYDKVTKQHLAFSFVNSKEEYIRQNVEMLVASQKNLNDLQPKILCDYDVVTGKVTPCNEEFGFDCYKMPATKADALAPLGQEFAKDALDFEMWRQERQKKLAEEKANKE